MFVICPDGLRDELLGHLHPSSIGTEDVFSTFPVLPKQRNVLVATDKIDEENVRAAIRHFIVNTDGWPKLAVARKHWDQQSLKEMQNVVGVVTDKTMNLCEAAIQKAERLPQGEWRADRLEQLESWKEIPSVQYGTMEIDSALKQNLKEFYPSFQPIEFGGGDSQAINSKPPVLHWPPEPLDGELQVILRISFPISGPDENTFREICRNLRQYGDHVYEWTGGILLTTDPVRLHVERVRPTIIELSARICVDELEGAAAEKPMKEVWPFLAVSLKETLNAIQHLDHMPYNIDLIPYGTQFYKPELNSRVFDLVQFMATAIAYKKVATRIDGGIHEVDMKLLLPDGPFDSLSQLLTLEPPSTRMSRTSSVQEAASNDNVTPLDTSLQNGGGLTVQHNKGRRVSFGSIKMMNESAVPVVNEVDAYVDGIVKESINLQSLYVD